MIVLAIFIDKKVEAAKLTDSAQRMARHGLSPKMFQTQKHRQTRYKLIFTLSLKYPSSVYTHHSKLLPIQKN